MLQLQAAFWVTRCVSEDGISNVELSRSFLHVPTGGLHDRKSLIAGQRLLTELGLLVEREEVVTPGMDLLSLRPLPLDAFVEAVLQRIFGQRHDMWLSAFTSADDVYWERVPADAAHLLRSVFEDPSRRAAFVISTARKVDAALLAEIGDDGEEAVALACREYLLSKDRSDLADQVARLSIHDDTLGYDVTSPDCRGRRHHLEVKATRSIGPRVEFYISRNEATVGANDVSWSIVIARQEIHPPDGVLAMRVIGWLCYADIVPALPHDAALGGHLHGRWASARITVPDDLLRPGLPLDRD
ncbi:protein NO VEIN domain-containing protein [Micromonospora sp. NPDC050276]|uniref:protein NO VEIN domain-containing protein n=1 Tax=Micromonospora sp. NPDC050276 TaxID=3364278 RepID=UPI0037AC20FB